MDSTELGRTPLADYYQAKGESPGRWMGSGLAGLGIKAGDVVPPSRWASCSARGSTR